MAYLCLTAFSQVYSENREPKEEQIDVINVRLVQKKMIFKTIIKVF